MTWFLVLLLLPVRAPACQRAGCLLLRRLLFAAPGIETANRHCWVIGKRLSMPADVRVFSSVSVLPSGPA